MKTRNGSVAQLNRASDYGSEGCGFESRRNHKGSLQLPFFVHSLLREKRLCRGMKHKKKKNPKVLLNAFAEGEGFKPPIPGKGIPDFESSAIVHSANLPW